MWGTKINLLKNMANFALDEVQTVFSPWECYHFNHTSLPSLSVKISIWIENKKNNYTTQALQVRNKIVKSCKNGRKHNASALLMCSSDGRSV